MILDPTIPKPPTLLSAARPAVDIQTCLHNSNSIAIDSHTVSAHPTSLALPVHGGGERTGGRGVSRRSSREPDPRCPISIPLHPLCLGASTCIVAVLRAFIHKKAPIPLLKHPAFSSSHLSQLSACFGSLSSRHSIASVPFHHLRPLLIFFLLFTLR